MANKDQYHLSNPAEWIDKVIAGAVIGTEPMPQLSEQFKAQFRDNIGAGSADNVWQPKGYFDTFEELEATITNPTPGDAYGVGAEAPYNIWVWDGLRGRWLNNGPIKGMDGKDGSDAEITAESIEAALGYVPADADNVGVPDGSIGTAQLANGAVTQEKLAEGIELGATMTKIWENLSPTSEMLSGTTITANISNGDLAVIFFRGGTDSSAGASAILPCGYSGRALIPYGNHLARRLIRVRNNEIEFDVGQTNNTNYETWTDNNKRAIPVLIYKISGSVS